VIILDTSGIIAALFPDQNRHEECARALLNAEPPRVLSPFVLAEVDYLIAKFANVQTELSFLEDVERGAYELASFTGDDLAAARKIIAKYASLRLGLADASIAVLANRYDTTSVLTLDSRHFRAIRLDGRKSVRVLPDDAE
jgi:predicted nucleic acid-binding protein